MKAAYRIFNGLVFYFGWFFVVYNAAVGKPYRGFVLCMVLVALHLAVVRNRRREVLLILFMTVVGFIVESAFVHFGVLLYASSDGVVAPLWVLGIYAVLAITLNHSLFWMRKYPYLSSVFGAGGAIVSYSAGNLMGAVTFLLPPFWTETILASAWFIMMPLFYQVNKWISHEKSGH